MALAIRPKPPAHHKKRLGKHHKTTKHYMKPYLPYLPLVAIVVTGLAINSFFLSPAKVLGDQTSISIDGLLAGTNQQRSANSEASLSLNDQLDNAAQAKANDMVARDYWSHTTPDGQQPWTFITAAGYTYSAAGENLAYGFDSSDAVIAGWMNSPEHRANMLNTGFKDVGFGIASSPNFVGTGPEVVVVAMYATPQAAATTTNITFSVPPKQTTTAPAPDTIQTPAQTEPVASTAPSTPSTQTTPQSQSQVATPTPGPQKTASPLPDSRKVARIQLLTNGQAAWSTAAVTLAGTITLGIFLVRHLRFWHKALIKSERFVIRHAWFDVLIVSLATACYILSRAAGVIG